MFDNFIVIYSTWVMITLYYVDYFDIMHIVKMRIFRKKLIKKKYNKQILFVVLIHSYTCKKLFWQ